MLFTSAHKLAKEDVNLLDHLIEVKTSEIASLKAKLHLTDLDGARIEMDKDRENNVSYSRLQVKQENLKTQLEQIAAKLESIVVPDLAALERDVDAVSAEFQNVHEQIISISAKANDFKAKLSNLQKIGVGECPTCYQEITGVYIQTLTESTTLAISQLREKYEEIEPKRKTLVGRINEARKLIDEAKCCKSQYSPVSLNSGTLLE